MNRLTAAAAAALLVASLQIASGTADAGTPDCVPSMNATGTRANGNLQCPRGTKKPGGTDKTKWTKGGKPPLCVWVPQPDYVPLPGEPVAGPDGQWYAHYCRFGEFDTLEKFEAEMAGWDDFDNIKRNEWMRRAGIRFEFFKTPPETRPTAEQVMYYIAGTIPFPETHLAVNPKAGHNKVNFPTWIWLTNANGQYDPATYKPQAKTISLFGYALEWQIVPDFAIDPGNGADQPTCAGIGIPYSPDANAADACTVTYTSAGTYTLTAAMNWTVKWQLGGVEQDDIQGPTNTATLPITVKERQTVVR
ncbi:hypothetical protein GCM10029976_077460 [Kribbella albertanoniae]|uniref:PKD domain-containing protein n=1 Tax=Kribbella albertanoniae TaxID=1266829 RepID=A0A4R4Q5Q7_9ACTN|nr:hypothetical protein [Kribbella albertanoniae]TDC30521.1 hypothetical protein E1261_13065 [Kribbella albertanoniae]